MKSTRRPRISVEQLEQRDCPSFVVRLTSGNLIVTGTPTMQTGEAIRFTQSATVPNRWTVIDGGGGI